MKSGGEADIDDRTWLRQLWAESLDVRPLREQTP
ncbi:hypothetical protein C8N44_1551 [Allosediminivita pacifica]|uniref:Uncharacterized protein n=1 Tax=Allosediminivita pacifica TaxID=1267769 RepID=A0A2T5ZYU2_9RHOB|nr:hypothetical protein C8N44_1551 [Allosediminivita pacifica]